MSKKISPRPKNNCDNFVYRFIDEESEIDAELTDRPRPTEPTGFGQSQASGEPCTSRSEGEMPLHINNTNTTLPIKKKVKHCQPTLQTILQKKNKFTVNHPVANEITTLIAEMVCVDDQPYHVVEKIGFKRPKTFFYSRYSKNV